MLASKINFDNKFNKRVLSLLTVAIIVSIGLNFKLPILGIWEQLTFYNSYAPSELSLNWTISERGATGSQAYGLLEISRKIVDFFDLNWNLFYLRLPPLVYGWVSLIIFFICAKRYFGFLPALLSTLLLSTNPLFLVFQHQLIIPIIAFLTIILFFDRMKCLELNPYKLSNWIFLSIPAVMCAINYKSSRYIAFAIFLFFVIKIISKNYDVLNALKKKVGLNILYSFLVFFITLFLLAPLNLIYLFLPDFVIPVGANRFDYSWNEYLESFSYNLRFIFESIIPLKLNFHTNYYSYVLGDGSYQLINVPTSILFLTGLFLSFIYLGKNKKFFIDNLLDLFFLFLFSIVFFLFSGIHTDPDLPSYGFTDISSYRLFYTLIPIHLFITLVIFRVLNFNINGSQFFKKIFLMFFIGLLLFNHSNVLSKNRLDYLTEKGESQNIENLIEEGTAKSWNFHVTKEYLNEHIQFRFLAKKVINAVEEYLHHPDITIKASAQNKTFIAEVDLIKNRINLGVEKDMEYLVNLNYPSVFLALYGSDLGFNSGFIQALYNGQIPWNISGAGNRFKGRLYSADLEFRDEKYVYVGILPSTRSDRPIPVNKERKYSIRTANEKLPTIIFTLNDEETKNAIRLLEIENISYEVLDF